MGKLEPLLSHGEPPREFHGQTGGENLTLARVDVVLDSAKLERILLRIVKTIGRARIAIARLPDRAWIHEVTVCRLELPDV